jgi:hypothetical protein
MPDTPPQPERWDRQPGEPNRWYDRFERFRLAGPSRSLMGTVNLERAEKGVKRQRFVPGAWAEAARRWCWRQRAEAWDERERQKACEARAQEVAEMNRRHIQEAQALQNKAVQSLKSLDPVTFSASDTLRFFVEATKLERTARGEPETIEERRLTGEGGGALRFTLEDALTAEKELEEWRRAHSQSSDDVHPQRDPQVP